MCYNIFNYINNGGQCMETNIKINYMLLEQILMVTGTYKNICNEQHEFLDVIFKQAKTGEIDSLFKDEKGVFNVDAKNIAFDIIENLTGVSRKYWSGQERIKLSMRCKHEDLNSDGGSINTVDLKNDYIPNVEDEDIEIYKDEITGKKRKRGYAYHGKFYQEQLKNPLHVEFDDIYEKVTGLEVTGKEDNIQEIENLNVIKSLYSLRGLLTVLLLNMEEIELIDKANIYKHSKWEPYIKKSNKLTQHGVIYSPKYVEIRKGLVQTIIKNLLDLGYVFTFRDLDKEFKIYISQHKIN